MGTTVDDLIDLKNEAVDACNALVAAWESRKLDELDSAARAAADAVARAELYDAADEDEDAVSIEHYEELESLCELEGCPMRDPHNPAGHKRRECEAA